MVCMTTHSLRPVLRSLLIAATVATALAGCTITTSSGRTSGTGEPAPSTTSADVFQIKVGDCVNDTQQSEVQELPQVDCAEPHDYEVYYQFQMTDAEFPGLDAATELAQNTCAEEFGTFVGTPYESTVLDLNYLTPTEDSWNRGNDRQISCLVYDPSGTTSGTLEGSAL